MILQITFRNTYKIRISKTMRRINYLKKLRMIIVEYLLYLDLRETIRLSS